MSDYIKREDAINAFYTATGDGDKAEWCVGVIHSIPAADVVKRNKGKRVRQELGPTRWKFCSMCGFANSRGSKWAFCPNCGADMRGEQDDSV